jgi:hypothetical protein
MQYDDKDVDQMYVKESDYGGCMTVGISNNRQQQQLTPAAAAAQAGGAQVGLF